MVKTIIQGPVQIQPRPDGGRDILVGGGPNHAYVIELPPQGVVELRDTLSMSDEELRQAAGRQQASARLAVPPGVRA